MPKASGMTAATLSRARGGNLTSSRYAELVGPVIEALREANCTTVNRAAMFLAQIGHESMGLRYMEEIASGAAYEGRRDLGNTQAGDGRRFKGRGPIQITGRHNYSVLSSWAHGRGLVPTKTYFVDHPAQLATDRYGFLGAVWYWIAARNMNGYADRRDIVGATIAVNGARNGLTDRTARWNRCLSLGTAILPGAASNPSAIVPDVVVPAGAQSVKKEGVPIVAKPVKFTRSKAQKFKKNKYYQTAQLKDKKGTVSLLAGPGTVYAHAYIVSDVDTWARFVTVNYKKGEKTKYVTRYPRKKIKKGGDEISLYDSISGGKNGYSRRVRLQILAYSGPVTVNKIQARAGKES